MELSCKHASGTKQTRKENGIGHFQRDGDAVFAVGVHGKKIKCMVHFCLRSGVLCMLIGLDTVGLMEDQTIV